MITQKFNFLEFLSRFMDKPEECELFLLLNSLPRPIPEKRWIAGGAIRRTCIDQPIVGSDIDFFFKDEVALKEFESEMTAIGGVETARNEHCITFAVTVDKKNILVQAITISYYETLESVIDSFDFTITQLGYDGENLVCGEFTLWDLARRRLALHKLTFVGILESVVNDPTLIEADIKYVD